MVEEAGLKIHYGKRFTKIVNEDGSDVEFEFADGTREKSDLLVGVDGIHSKVTSYILPNIQSQYGGGLGPTFCFPCANVQLWNALPLPVSLRGELGTIILQLQTKGGNEINVGRQFKYEHQDRARWDALLQDKPALNKIIQGDTDA